MRERYWVRQCERSAEPVGGETVKRSTNDNNLTSLNFNSRLNCRYSTRRRTSYRPLEYGSCMLCYGCTRLANGQPAFVPRFIITKYKRFKAQNTYFNLWCDRSNITFWVICEHCISTATSRLPILTSYSSRYVCTGRHSLEWSHELVHTFYSWYCTMLCIILHLPWNLNLYAMGLEHGPRRIPNGTCLRWPLHDAIRISSSSSLKSRRASKSVRMCVCHGTYETALFGMYRKLLLLAKRIDGDEDIGNSQHSTQRGVLCMMFRIAIDKLWIIIRVLPPTLYSAYLPRFGALHVAVHTSTHWQQCSGKITSIWRCRVHRWWLLCVDCAMALRLFHYFPTERRPVLTEWQTSGTDIPFIFFGVYSVHELLQIGRRKQTGTRTPDTFLPTVHGGEERITYPHSWALTYIAL